MKIAISDEIAYKQESYSVTNSNLTLVIIADAYASYAYQKGIVKILEELIQRYNLMDIFVEGGWGDVSLPELRRSLRGEDGKQIAEQKLKSRDFSAEEYLYVISDYPIRLIGIDNKELHNQSQQLVMDAHQDIVGFMQIVDPIKKQLRIIRRNLSDPSLEVVERIEDYNREKIRLSELYNYILAESKAVGVDLGSRFPNFINLAVRMGLSVPFEWTLSASEAVIKDRVDEIESINETGKAFDEAEEIIGYLKEAKLETKEQREIARADENLEILRRLANLELLPKQFKVFKERPHEFSSETFADILCKFNMPVLDGVDLIDFLVPAMERFYELTAKRHEHFVDNIVNHYENCMTQKLAVLIIGGFHLPGVTSRLRTKKVSYQVLLAKTPKSSEHESHDEQKRKLFSVYDRKKPESIIDEPMAKADLRLFRDVFPSYKKYSPVRIIGSGGLKTTIEFRDPSRKMIAVKMVKMTDVSERWREINLSEDPVSHLKKETDRMQLLNTKDCPHISELLAVKFVENPGVYITIEQYAERTLMDYAELNFPLVKKFLNDVALQIADGLRVIHSMGYYHGDLKLDNILYRNGLVQITDFGLASRFPSNFEELAKTESLLAMPYIIRAPELFEKRQCSTASDIWAFGVDMVYLGTHRWPFPLDFNGTGDEWIKLAVTDEREKYIRTIYEHIMNDDDYNAAMNLIDKAFDTTMATIVKRCLIRDRSERIQDGIQLVKTISDTNVNNRA